MEHVARSTGVSPLLRPVTALQGDLAAVLREGRTLAGEVLQRLDGSTYVISVAGQRVAAESRVELEVGRSARFEVVRHGGELALRPLVEGAPPRSEPALLVALRALSGTAPPLEDALARLAGAIADEPGAGRSDPRAAAIARALAARVLDPAAGADGLRAALARGGAGATAALLAAMAEAGLDTPARALAGLAGVLAPLVERALRRGGRWTDALDGGALARELEAALGRALARTAPAGLHALGRAEIAALASALHAELVRALRARSGAAASGDAIVAALEELGPRALLDAGELPLLRALFLPESGAEGFTRALRALALAGFERDLLGLVLGLAGDDVGGEIASAARAAARSLELGELLHRARHEGGESVHLAFVIGDASGRARVDLLADPRAHERDDATAREGWRLTVGVDFASLGPVRADLYVRRDSLALRIGAERPATVERLERALGALRESLAALGREVALTVVQASEHETRIADAARDARILAEHHLMDVRG